MEGKSLNRRLGAAKAAKQDEFYTQYVDIQSEVEAYLEFDPDAFRGKSIYCNCDDPFESNFFKYFAANFNKLGLRKLVTTSYDGSPIAGQGTLFPEYDEGNGHRQKPKALAVVLDQVKDEDGDGAANVTDVELFLKRNKAARIALKGSNAHLRQLRLGFRRKSFGDGPRIAPGRYSWCHAGFGHPLKSAVIAA